MNKMTLYKQASCFICTQEIWSESLDGVHCLWDDSGYVGRPVCWSCYWLLKMYCPKKLDVPIYKFLEKEPKKIGIEKFL